MLRDSEYSHDEPVTVGNGDTLCPVFPVVLELRNIATILKSKLIIALMFCVFGTNSTSGPFFPGEIIASLKIFEQGLQPRIREVIFFTVRNKRLLKSVKIDCLCYDFLLSVEVVDVPCFRGGCCSFPAQHPTDEYH
ncbi:MAG: hypothetical protein HGA33_00715 [Candidatus Moranbacteria bacterium]|nr:hypothetical protein [Candidatus Moranbacteria bacterium]